MVHVCKMIQSPAIFFFFSFFQNFDFLGCKGAKGQKMTQNGKKLSAAPYISETIHNTTFTYDTHV